MDNEIIPAIERQQKTAHYMIDGIIDLMVEAKVWIEWEKGAVYNPPYTHVLRELESQRAMLHEAYTMIRNCWVLIQAAKGLKDTLTGVAAKEKTSQTLKALSARFMFCLVETKNLSVIHSEVKDRVNVMVEQYTEQCYSHAIEETT